MWIEQGSTIEAITNLLFVQNTLPKADLIFVFGNDWLETMDDVARLYHRNVCGTVIITGHSALSDRAETEAKRFYDRGIELGIPAGSMILEEEATNTKENILKSVPLIEERIGINRMKSILFVCKAFHTRRVLMTARNVFPDTVAYGFHPTLDERDIRATNWWTTPDRQERVLAEVRRIAEYALKGDLTVR